MRVGGVNAPGSEVAALSGPGVRSSLEVHVVACKSEVEA